MLPVLSISGAKVIQFLNKLLILAENFYDKTGEDRRRPSGYMDCMKLFLRTAIGVLLSGLFAQAPVQAKGDHAGIKLISNLWSMSYPDRPSSALSKEETVDVFQAPENVASGFTVRMDISLCLPTSERKLLEIPGVMDVLIRQHDPLDRTRQNYPSYRMPDGSVPVLEARLWLYQSPDGNAEAMTVGIPMAMLDNPAGRHEVVLTFSGAKWTMYVDNALMDNDFPFGYPRFSPEPSWRIDCAYVNSAELYFPAVGAERTENPEKSYAPVQYWTPTGHNTWVGDVVSIFHEGTYHLFYLYDRRGHQSKFGRGGHYFEHLSTRDFIHWTEHEPAVPIDEQWETFGTGTPFIKDGRFYISYGYHTTRLCPYEETTLPEEHAYLDKYGCTGPFRCGESDKTAAGSSYSVSDDGAHFRKSGVIFHPCENPSVFTDSTGRLMMFANYAAKGTWTSDSLDCGWHCINKDFPLGGDCTFPFTWDGYDYVIGGFTSLWAKKSGEPDSAYRDVVAEGLDFYNGIGVPSVTRIFDGRYVMAGWLWLKAWGGPLVIHELVRLDDGRIGNKWMEELVPQTGRKVPGVRKAVSDTVDVPSSFILSFDVTPVSPDGSLTVSFLPDHDKGLQDAFVWNISLDENRACYSGILSDGTFARKMTLREGVIRQGISLRSDYAVENLPGTDSVFTVRILVTAPDKFDGSVVDTEIARKRTMLSYREHLEVSRMSFNAEGVKVGNIEVRPVEDADMPD